MEFAIKPYRQWTIMSLKGRLDAVNSPTFEKEALAALQDQGMYVAIDFSALEYISSAGLRSILILGKNAKGKGGNLILCNLKGMVKEVMEISGFDAFFALLDSIEDLPEV